MEVLSLPRPGGRIVVRSPRLLATLPDERLVDEVRQGNEAAFEVIYDRHHRGILSFCRHMLASREEAEDAVQQAFVSAYRDLVSSDRPIKLKAWLYTIARNRCLSILRARHEQPAELDDVPTIGLAEEVQHRDELRRLLADVRDLPDDQRAALVLSELGDLSHAEVAEIVGCETLKVKSLVFQARSSLAESREARDIPCQEIREQLSTLHGGALRRGPLRRHLRACPGCAAFREEVRRQRAMLAIVMPVVSSAALKHGVFAALEIGPGAGAAAGGLAVATTNGAAGAALTGSAGAGVGGAGAGGVVSAIGASGAAKLAVAVVVAGVAVGGGVAVKQVVSADHPTGKSAANGRSSDAAGGSTGSGAGAAGQAGAAGTGANGQAGAAGTGANGHAVKATGKSSSAAARAHAKGHGASHGHGHGATGHHGKSAQAKSGSSAAQGQSQTSNGSASSHHKGGGAKPQTTGQHPQHPVHPTTPSGSGLTHTTEHPPPPPKKPPQAHVQASDGSTAP